MKITEGGRHFWLIQRCFIKDVEDPRGIDVLFNYDYMGSAEFEFGAVWESLKRICTDLDQFEAQRCVIARQKIRSQDGKALLLFCKNEVRDEILQFLEADIRGEANLLERTRLASRLRDADRDRYPDAWWDISNDWIAFLGERNQTRLTKALQGSRTRLKEKGKIP